MNNIQDILEQNGYTYTDDISKSIYMLENGQLISGNYQNDIRTIDHREIAELLITDKDRYDKDFWSTFHDRTGIIMIVPEIKEILLMENQKLSTEQEKMLKGCLYKIEKYCKKFC